MTVGKLKNETLGEVVFSEIDQVRTDILIRPGVGEDCAAIAYGDLACVLTTDPITGSGSQLGRLAVNVCLNDIASSGAEGVGLMLTLLCPVGTKPHEIQSILREANQAAKALGVEIIGGHTEITDAVNRTIVSATAVGKMKSKDLISTSGANAGDWLYMTKQVATEGTAIIANDREMALKAFLTDSELNQAKAMMEQISVVSEGQIGVLSGVSAMHDATEGGVLGAIHELCEASGAGCVVFKNQFTLSPITEKICKQFDIDPFKLISSGTMIMTINPVNAGLLESNLSAAGIVFSKIGYLTENLDKVLATTEDDFEKGLFTPIASPESDELYKVI